MRELVTLQFGSYANFVGAHFWNLQDELYGQASTGSPWDYASLCLPSEVLYRTGMHPDTRTEVYQPRVMIVDKSGSLGSLSAGDMLQQGTQEPPRAVSTWGGRTSFVRRAPVEPHAFQRSLLEMTAEPETQGRVDLGGPEAFRREFEAAVEQYLRPATQDEDGTVAPPNPTDAEVRLLRAAADLDRTARYFTDFLKAELHPKSLTQLPGVWDGVSAFGGWGEGWDLAGRAEVRDELDDRLRFFTEDCDNLQGFQVLVDSSSAFGALAARFLAEVADDYPKTPLVVFSLRKPQEPALRMDFGKQRGALSVSDASLPPSVLTQLRTEALNDALEAAFLAPAASLYVPVQCPWRASSRPHGALQWDPSSDYQSSAVLAGLLDTALLPSRTAPSPASHVLGTPLGCGIDLGVLVRAARGDGTAGNIANLSAIAPSPKLERELAVEAEDSRVKGGEESSDRRLAMDGRWTSFTPDAEAEDPDVISEAVVLRGCRTAHPDALCSTSAAQEALALALFPRMPRCPKRLCVLPFPMAVPVTFPPRCFSGHGAKGFRVPSEVALLTRMGCSRGGKMRVRHQRAVLKNLGMAGEGKTLLDAWGLGSDETRSVWEKLGEIEEDYLRGEEDADDDLDL